MNTGTIEEISVESGSNGPYWKIQLNSENQSYNAFASDDQPKELLSSLDQGDTIKYSLDDAGSYTNLVNIEEVEEDGEAQMEPVQGDRREQTMSRQKPIEAVGQIFQGNPPRNQEEYKKMRMIAEDLSQFSNTGEWKHNVKEVFKK